MSDEEDHEGECQCAICSGEMSHESLADKIIIDIKTMGCSNIGVAGEGYPPWVYSIGFCVRRHPEFVISALPPAVSNYLINDLCAKVAAGEVFKAGDKVEKLIAEYPVVLKQVDPANYDEFFGIGRDFTRMIIEAGGEDTGVLQIVWPDPSGKFQWEEGFDEKHRQQQFWKGES